MQTHKDERMNKQPLFNVGMLGSVADGKSTCVRVLTGIKTQRHSNEKNRNITIKPGYANMKIWSKDSNLKSTDSKPSSLSNDDGEEMDLVHHISFIDCPGHQELILTMLGSIRLMKGVIVIVSASEEISKKPQLIQHLAAIKLAGIKKVIVCLNKLDLIDKSLAISRHKDLIEMLKKFEIEPCSIIPTSFNKNVGIDWLLNDIIKYFQLNDETDDSDSEFLATRSFDINKAGMDFSALNGGVIGGSLVSGTLKVDDVIEVRPGICGKLPNGKLVSKPIRTPVLSIQTDQEKLSDIQPGGLMGIGTTIDPFYCKDDLLAGNRIGLVGTLPPVYDSVELKYKIIEDFGGNWNPKMGDIVSLQFGTLSITSNIIKTSKKTLTFNLSKPACVEDSTVIFISKKEDGIMKIVALGEMKSGNKLVE